MTRLHEVLALVVLGAAACGLGEVTLPAGEEQVVVQGVLNAQSSQQVLWIERTTAAGAPIQFGLRPLAEPPSRVEVQDQVGAVFPFAPDPSNPARFVATFTPSHGGRYDLLVEAGARMVRGRAVVPPAISIVDPASDTVWHAAGAELRVSWASETSRHVAFYVTADTSDVSGYVFPTWVRDDTVAAVSFYSGAGTRLVWVMAADSVTARLFPRFGDGSDFHGNLTGGAGFFGAVTTDRVVVRLQ